MRSRCHTAVPSYCGLHCVMEPNSTTQKRVHARARWWMLRQSYETSALSRGSEQHTQARISAGAQAS